MATDLILMDENFKTLLVTPMGYTNLKQYCKHIMLTRDVCYICYEQTKGAYPILAEVFKNSKGKVSFKENYNNIKEYHAEKIKPKLTEQHIENTEENEKEYKKDNENMDYTIRKVDENSIYVIVDADKLARQLEEIITEVNETNIERAWKSKYNDFVSYDYEPFAVNGFNLECKIKFNSEQIRDWYAYRIEQSAL